MPAIQEPTIHQHEPQQMQLNQKEMEWHLSEQIGQMPWNPNIQQDH
jgi:hypothetical protein